MTLGAGAYTFELVDSSTGNDIVRVMNKERSRVYFMGFTQLVARPAGLPANRFVTLYGAAAGIAPSIDIWYSPDDATGHRFLYSNR